MTFLSAPIGLLLDHRKLLAASVALEIRQNYAGSAGGGVWLLLGPLILMTIYVTIYAFVLRVSAPNLNSHEYVAILVMGIGTYIGFAQGITSGVSSLLANKHVLLNTVYPAELLAPKGAILSATVVVVAASAALAINAISGGMHVAWTGIPLVLIAQILFTTGVSYVLSVVNIAVRDIQFVTGYILICLMIASPIAYRPEMVPAGLKAVIYANPLSYFILAYQELILGNWPSMKIALIVTLLSVPIFISGFHFFRATKKTIADTL